MIEETEQARIAKMYTTTFEIIGFPNVNICTLHCGGRNLCDTLPYLQRSSSL